MQVDWQDAYAGVQSRIRHYVERARWTLCGMSACVDAFAPLEVCDPLLAAGPAAARALGEELRRRAAAGIGGEIRIDWPEGNVWVDGHLPVRPALGGTAAHAVRVLTLLRAPALLALEHRGIEQMAVMDPDMPLAERDRIVRARDVMPATKDRLRIYVFEFTAGRPVGPVVPPRSSRIIVRFHDIEIERDEAFRRLGPDLVRGGGAGVLAGFNALASGEALASAVSEARSLALCWREAGIATIHLELAGYNTEALRDQAIAGLAGAVTSIGMSLSELRAIDPETQLEEAMCRIGGRLGLERVCVHADGWAISATRRDPDQEREALMMGCLLASARAAHGQPVVPAGTPAEAQFEAAPPECAIGGWTIVSCASPFLEHPVTTLGLGDTFMAGSLLVLGQDPLVPHWPGQRPLARSGLATATRAQSAPTQ